MKEATGEVSMTVVTIVILALLLGIGTWLFSGDDAIGKKWIENMFNNQINNTTNQNPNTP